MGNFKTTINKKAFFLQPVKNKMLDNLDNMVKINFLLSAEL